MGKMKIIPKGFYGVFLILVLIGAGLFTAYCYIAVTQGSPPSVSAIVNRNIRIDGKAGMMTYNIYIESNPSESNGYYSIYRLVYNSKQYKFDPSDFDTLSEIRRQCDFCVRKQPDANSLVYTDWDVGTEENFNYLYIVTQDDGDFSEPVIFGKS